MLFFLVTGCADEVVDFVFFDAGFFAMRRARKIIEETVFRN